MPRTTQGGSNLYQQSIYVLSTEYTFSGRKNHYVLRKLAHAIYRDFLAVKNENFQQKKFDIFLIFAQNIDCGYTLELPQRGSSNEYPHEAVLMSTHNLCLGAKIRKIGLPLHTPVLLYKSGV